MKLSDYISLIVMVKDSLGDIEITNFNNSEVGIDYNQPVISVVEQKGFGTSHLIALSGTTAHPETIRTFNHISLENHRAEKLAKNK